MTDVVEPKGRRASAIGKLAEVIERRIDTGVYAPSERLPTEREFAQQFGISRAAARKALDELDRKGLIWRHVGKGTFVGRQPETIPRNAPGRPLTASPREIIDARIGLEPVIAGHAAQSASSADIAHLLRCCEQLEAAPDWPTFEIWDRRIHRGIALASRNAVFVAFLDTINQLREGEVWLNSPLPDVGSEAQLSNTAMHRKIVEAIGRRDMHAAIRLMRTHLEIVRTMYVDVPVVA